MKQKELDLFKQLFDKFIAEEEEGRGEKVDLKEYTLEDLMEAIYKKTEE